MKGTKRMHTPQVHRTLYIISMNGGRWTIHRSIKPEHRSPLSLVAGKIPGSPFQRLASNPSDSIPLTTESYCFVFIEFLAVDEDDLLGSDEELTTIAPLCAEGALRLAGISLLTDARDGSTISVGTQAWLLLETTAFRDVLPERENIRPLGAASTCKKERKAKKCVNILHAF
jgi:hypothetical protein